MFENYNHLGSFNPYYILDAKSGFHLHKDFAGVCHEYPSKREIDIVSIVEFVNKSYFLGDRTIVKGINRAPWMSKPAADGRSWERFNVPDHDENMIDVEAMAEGFFERICTEIEDYIKGHKKIGILLSGGMDSRIVAGTLDYLIKKNKIEGLEVVGLTWGNDDSRDVQYAKEIARRMNWGWKHYVVTPEHLLTNIAETARNGCEYSPIHLHALLQIRDDNDLDVVLAGSYGDSIGRAEYSSVKVKNLKPIDAHFRNVNNLLSANAYAKHAKTYKQDIEMYHRMFPQQKPYQQYEQDYQLHYMRRLLNPCMEIVGNKFPLQQVFTSPEVFGYMWKIHPDRRNDELYARLIKFFATDLTDIPWARTGLPYGAKSGTPDNFKKQHHSYKQYLTQDLFEDMKKMVLSGNISNLGIFNMTALKMMLRLSHSTEHQTNWYIDKLSWIAALSQAIEIYGLQTEKLKSGSLFDQFAGIVQTPLEFYSRKAWSEIKSKIK